MSETVLDARLITYKLVPVAQMELTYQMEHVCLVLKDAKLAQALKIVFHAPQVTHL